MESTVLKQLIFACEKNDLEAVKNLVPSQISGDGPNGQVSPLHICAEKGYTEIGEYLLTCGKATVKRRDKYTNSPIHYAAKQGQARFLQMLLKFRCDVNMKGLQFTTPLHLAAEGNHVVAFQILLMNNANLFQENKDKKTPMEFAISSEFYGDNNVNPLILQTLFKHFPKETRERIEHVYHNGWPHKRFHNREVCNILREYMPDYVNLVFQYISDLTKPHLDEMLDMGWDVKLLNQDGETIIHSVIRCYIRRMQNLYVSDLKSSLLWTKEMGPYLSKLLSIGSDINHPNTEGETPFLVLCKNSEVIYQDDAFLQMIQNGASVNMCDNNGMNPLQTLITGVKPKVFVPMIKAGVQININFIGCCEALLNTFSNTQQEEFAKCLQIKYLLSAGLKGFYVVSRSFPQHQIEKFEKAVLKYKDCTLLLQACGYRFSNMNDSCNILSEVNSLRNMTARSVCENLYPNAWISVEKLEIPTPLKKLITFNHYEFKV